MTENLKWVASAEVRGRTLHYTPSPNFENYIRKRFAGQFSKNRRIKKKQFKRFMNEMLLKALDNIASSVRERFENKA